jgi:DNA-binding XRE family transcriptional regulator
MGVSLNEMLARLPREEREAVKARTAELVAQEMSLRDLRKALGKTQVAMAGRLGIKQENVSRIEQRSDMLLSTLNGYLRGMGGRLRLVAEFEGRAPVELAGLADVAMATAPAKRKAPARHVAQRKSPMRP